MPKLKYISYYPEHTKEQARQLIDDNKLGNYLLKKYPNKHSITTDKLLYDYVIAMKNKYLKNSTPLSKAIYDSKTCDAYTALGLHTLAIRVQGGKLKSKNEIRVASTFKNCPEEFLRMIVVHELAHLKERAHDKTFYSLCTHMESGYHQLEFDTRLYLTHIELFGELYMKNETAQ